MTDTASMTVNRTLLRKPNADYRPREYLTEAEIERLIEAARKRGRNGARDSAAILLAFRQFSPPRTRRLTSCLVSRWVPTISSENHSRSVSSSSV
jgi:hypothetical protein